MLLQNPNASPDQEKLSDRYDARVRRRLPVSNGDALACRGHNSVRCAGGAVADDDAASDMMMSISVVMADHTQQQHSSSRSSPAVQAVDSSGSSLLF